MDYSRRQLRLMGALSSSKLDAMLLTHLPNIQYLCGFTGSSGVLIASSGGWAFFTDGRYTEQAKSQVRNARVFTVKGPALTAAADWARRKRLRFVGIEAAHMPVSVYSSLLTRMPKSMRVKEITGLVEQLRMVKDSGEIELIRAAALMGTKLLTTALSVIRPGVAETAIAAKIEYAARRAGAQGMSFETIVAAGQRSALPHGVASNKPVPRNGFVVMDFGVILASYCSDMTRTVHVGKTTRERRHIYDAVREAQQAGIDAVRPGVEAGKIDAASRRVLQSAGLAKFFTHSSGHGVGLEIHEPPRLGKGQKELLEPGMVITIEPGAYVPGKGGVRIEDMVLVTEQGCEVLTPATKELISI